MIARMIRRPLWRGFALLAWLAVAAPALADKIFLKSGQVLEGVVDRERSTETHVVFRTAGATSNIDRSRIERIEFSENVSEDEIRGDFEARRGDFSAALASYRRALAADPTNERLARRVEEMQANIARAEAERFSSQRAAIDEAIRLREFDKAIDFAGKLIDRAPEGQVRDEAIARMADAYIGKARDHANTVDYAKAEISYRAAMQIAPNNAVAPIELAKMIDSYPNRRQDAFDLFSVGLKLAEATPGTLDPASLRDFQYAFAELHTRMEKPFEAAALFWRIAQAPESRYARTAVDRIARAYEGVIEDLVPSDERSEAALTIMRQVAAANPSNAKIPAMLGQVYFERGLWSQAIPYLEASILNAGNVRGGRNSDTRYYLGIAFRRTDRNVDAATQLREVLRAQPTRYEAICELGEVSLELFRVEEALPLFQRAIPLDPSNERAYAGAARCYRLDKNYDEAMKLYERLVQIRANEPEYLFELGTVYAQLESHEKARRTFLTVIDLIAPGGEPKPESIDRLTECYANLAQTSIAIKNYAEALGHFDSALKLRPNYAPAFDGKGQAYRELENLEQAEVFFKRAIEAAPTKPDYYLNLGVFYHRYKKDTKAALPNYFKYYELGGTDPQVRGWIEEAGGRIPPPIRPDGA